MLEDIFKEYDNHPPFDIPKTKEEADKLSEELWELSENEEQNIDRMKEIAKILTLEEILNKSIALSVAVLWIENRLKKEQKKNTVNTCVFLIKKSPKKLAKKLWNIIILNERWILHWSSS